ncbi:MAG: RDD family protein [Clostridia bacterium]|nr:RDD family protein [Clostridia bacterium]
MIYGLQKAGLLKRASAFLLDILLLITVASMIIMLLLPVTGQESYAAEWAGIEDRAVTEYKASVGLTPEIEKELSEEEMEAHQKAFDKAFKEMAEKDPHIEYVYSMYIQLTLVCITVGLLLACLLLEFLVPLLLKNGQTLGKKMFALGVMRVDGVKISNFALFVRSVLGKFTIEIMVPVYVFMMLMFGAIGFIGTIVLLLLLGLEIGVMIATKTNSMIHDLISATVVIDLPSQMIFDTPEAMLEYKKKLHAEEAEKQSY